MFRAFLSILHPSLLTSLILIEPMIQKDHPPGPNAALPSTFRKDVWPSRAAAEASFRKNKFFSSWDHRVLDLYLNYGLRNTPTPIYPAAPAGSVTLTTTKHQEAWTYLRSRLEPLSNDDHVERLLSPDLDPTKEGKYLYHRAEPGLVLESLPYIRPPVLYIYGDNSPISTTSAQDTMMNRTGAGLGGSGGAKAARVAKTIIPNSGHLVPMDKVTQCAQTVGAELSKQLLQFRADKAILESHHTGKSERDGLIVSKAWQEGVRKPSSAKRPTKEKL